MMKHRLHRLLSLLLAKSAVLAAMAAAACVPMDVGSDSWTVGGGCDDWDCGSNSAVINGFPVHELNLAGAVNDNGFRIINYYGGESGYLTLDVAGGEFRGLDSQGNTVLTGADVVGSTITVFDGSVYWEIEIAGYTNSLQYWVGPAAYVSAYYMRYRPRGRTEWIDLCKDPRSVALDPGWTGGYHAYALLIEDERYDPDAIEVLTDPAGDWFNIACAGTVLSKMILKRYNPMLPPGDPYYTTWEERQAALKSISADVCGTGRPFTVTGQPLLWANDAGWHIVDSADVATTEAVWTKDGALCLDTPRLSGDSNHPNLLADIAAECGGVLPPSCAEPAMLDWTAVGEWKTYNPN